MFKREEMTTAEVETIIGPSVKVEGDFVAAGDVIVEGMVSGTLRTDQHLRVGEHAKISANVSAGSALVAGEIVGNLTVRDNLEITSTGKVFGDLKTKVLTVAAGATLNGKCQVGEEPRPAPAKVERPEGKPNRDSPELLRSPAAKVRVGG